MLTDSQCNEFRRLPLPFNDMVREIFKAGFIAGDSAQDGAMGCALKNLEDAVRADRLGCIAVTETRDKKGHWLESKYTTVRKALADIDKLRDAAKG